MNIKEIIKRYGTYLIFIPIIVIAFSFRIGSGWYFHNDGVSLTCSMESVLDLVHPGKWDVKGCTYDHQPLYYLLVKAVTFIAGTDLVIYQWINVLFFIMAWLILTKSLSRKTSILLPGAVVFFFMSSFSVLYWIQELRMYALYLLGCFFVISELESIDSCKKLTRKKKVLHLLNYFNFFLYLLPFGAYVFTYIRKCKTKITKSFKFFLISVIVLVLIKIPFIYFWRVMLRSGGQNKGLSDIVNIFNRSLFEGNDFYLYTAYILSAFGVGWSIFNDRKSIKTQTYYLLFLFTFMFALLTSVGLQMHEIELRYFLYLYPIIIIFVFKFLNNIPNKYIRDFVSIALMTIGFYNSSQMYRRGEPNGGEIKKSAKFIANVLENQEQVWTDHPYFYFNYIGIYSYLLNNKKVEVKNIKSFKPLEKNSYFISVQMTEKEHLKKLNDLGVTYKRLYTSVNFLGSKSIVTELINDKNQH